MPAASRLYRFALKIGLVLAALVVVALAVASARAINTDDEVLRAAEAQAEVMRGALGQSTLARDLAKRRPTRAERARVSRQLNRVARESDAMAVRLVDRRGRVAYSSVPGERGGKLATSPELRAALAGVTASERQKGQKTTSVGAYAPLRIKAASRPAGVLNTDTPVDALEGAAPGGPGPAVAPGRPADPRGAGHGPVRCPGTTGQPHGPGHGHDRRPHRTAQPRAVQLA